MQNWKEKGKFKKREGACPKGPQQVGVRAAIKRTKTTRCLSKRGKPNYSGLNPSKTKDLQTQSAKTQGRALGVTLPNEKEGPSYEVRSSETLLHAEDDSERDVIETLLGVDLSGVQPKGLHSLIGRCGNMLGGTARR